MGETDNYKDECVFNILYSGEGRTLIICDFPFEIKRQNHYALPKFISLGDDKEEIKYRILDVNKYLPDSLKKILISQNKFENHRKTLDKELYELCNALNKEIGKNMFEVETKP